MRDLGTDRERERERERDRERESAISSKSVVGGRLHGDVSNLSRGCRAH